MTVFGTAIAKARLVYTVLEKLINTGLDDMA